MRRFLVAVAALTVSGVASPVMAQIQGLIAWDPPTKAAARHARRGGGRGTVNLQLFLSDKGSHHIIVDPVSGASGKPTISDGHNSSVHVKHCEGRCSHADEADVQSDDPLNAPVLVSSSGKFKLNIK